MAAGPQVDGQSADGTSPASGGSRLGPGAVPFAFCRGAWPRGQVGRQQARRFFARLSETLKETDAGSGTRWIDGSVRLPSGQRADGFVQTQFPYKPPVGWRAYSRDQRCRWRLAVERELRFTAFLQRHPHLNASERATYTTFAKSESLWLAAAGRRYWPCGRPLPATKSAMTDARRALAERREIPRRGRPTGTRKRDWDPRAAALFDQVYWHESQREAADVVAYLGALAAREGFTPPTPHMVRERIAAMPHGAKVLLRQGRKRFTESCVPKARRSRKSVRGWASFDCRKADFWARTSDGEGGQKAVRLVLSGCYLPFSRKWSALRFGLSENAALIAATVRDAVRRDGLPRLAHMDNGGAYDALTGSPRGTEVERQAFEDGGVGGFFSTFGVEIVKADPYAAWQKAVESAWNFVKRHLDRWTTSFCGGTPAERPEKLTRWLRDPENVATLPTLGEAQRWANDLLAFLNAKPRRGLGGLTPGQYHAEYGPTRRVVDDDTLQVYLSPVVGSRRVGRDGVKFDGHLYELAADDLVVLQRKRVWLRVDPDDAGVVTLCAQDGTAVARAYNRELEGAGHDVVRTVRRRAREYKIAVAKYASVRGRGLETKTSEVLRVRREHAALEEGKSTAALGLNGKRDTTIVRPDLAASARAMKQRDAQRAAARTPVKRKAVGSGAVTPGATQDELLAAFASAAPAVDPRAEAAQRADTFWGGVFAGEAAHAAHAAQDRQRSGLQKLAARYEADAARERAAQCEAPEALGTRWAASYRRDCAAQRAAERAADARAEGRDAG